jgi:proline iminopeptidase
MAKTRNNRKIKRVVNTRKNRGDSMPYIFSDDDTDTDIRPAFDLINKYYNQTDSSIFIFIYMNGCGWCDQFKPIWKEFTEHVRNTYKGNVIIAQVEIKSLVDSCRNIVETLNPIGFPFIAYCKENKVVEYDKERSVDGLKTFATEHNIFSVSQRGGLRQIGGFRMYRTNLKTSPKYVTVDNHKIAYYTYGNKNGIPIVMIHGGPGGKSLLNLKYLMDLERFYVVFIDQRFSGKSKGKLDFTIDDLTNDIEIIRKKLNIQKWVVCGGSWGSTLALYYSINHSQFVNKLLIYGVFLCSKEEIDWIENGVGSSMLFPNVWDKYYNFLTSKEKKSPLTCYEKLINKTNTRSRQGIVNYNLLEMGVDKLIPENFEKLVNKKYSKDEMQAMRDFAEISLYFFTRKCFIKDDFFKKNVHKIRDIPTTIIQGQYDIVCPMKSAHNIHKLLPKSKLIVTHAGHSVYDHDNYFTLIKYFKTLK